MTVSTLKHCLTPSLGPFWQKTIVAENVRCLLKSKDKSRWDSLIIHHYSPSLDLYHSSFTRHSACVRATKLKCRNAFACTWHFLKGFVTLYAIFLKAKTYLHINWILKIMVQFCYLRLFKHWICFLFSVATWWCGWTWIEKGNGWVNPFLVLIICQQNHQTLRLSAAWWIVCDGFFITQQDNLVNVSGH